MSLVLPRPTPYLIWRKDGEKIVDGVDGYHLPADHYNRLLIIKEVTQEHQGNYRCTAYSTSGSFDQASMTTFLTVKGLKRNQILQMLRLLSRNESLVTRFYLSTCVVVMVNWLRFQWQIVGL